MKTIKISRVVSFSKNKTHAQVIVLVGKGRNQRSHTRQLNHAMVGLNIDPRAIPLNEKYAEELAEARSEMLQAKKELKELLDYRDNVLNVEATEEKSILSDEERADLEAKIEAAQNALHGTENALYDAQSALAHVRRECPRQCEFTGVF